jgi:hypothetical protein
MENNAIRWQKSSYSDMAGPGNCVEVAAVPHGLLLRESEQPSTVVTARPFALAALLHAIKRGACAG